MKWLPMKLSLEAATTSNPGEQLAQVSSDQAQQLCKAMLLAALGDVQKSASGDKFRETSTEVNEETNG